MKIMSILTTFQDKNDDKTLETINHVFLIEKCGDDSVDIWELGSFTLM
jgi:hypothetical protein